ncbi:hypothetical protein TBR22_A04070 [Luteitalea sp. TBR-22]|uniref:hypothetical protein n=1 Tax=Luteitalea sp. TBR-22 TaxID=2802971 RepID=UPI001AFC6AD3|nr:hypothetical protein [Luteitalea sp. TBR-22]BCS31207.1 hypothetical protein TBR22_A04070 [Luteitalea sp. TBR-22]
MRRSLLATAFGLLAIAATASATPVRTQYTLVHGQGKAAAHATSNATGKTKKEKTKPATAKDGAAQVTKPATKPTTH